MTVFEKDPKYDLDHVMQSKTIMDFDERFTRKTFDFDSVHDYYYQASCYHYLPQIKRPTLCLNALDDPIVPGKVIPFSQLLANPWILLATTQMGGHLGWYQNWFYTKRWHGEPLADFISALLKVVCVCCIV